MTKKNHRGRIVWHDMMTTDLAASKAFYTDLFGWRIETFDMGHGPYDMLHAGEVAIGGLVPLDPKEAPGVPSHWIAYVDVEDAAACAQRNEAAGGKTCVPIMDIREVGKFGVFTDPGGAVISPFQDAGTRERPPLPDRPPVGAFIWDELHSKDPAASMEYYGATFGWTFKDLDMGEMGVYRVFQGADGTDVGGILQSPGEGDHHAWLSYVHTDDVDASHVKATELGAQTFVPPRDIPGIGRFAVMADTTGGMFAVYQPAPTPA